MKAKGIGLFAIVLVVGSAGCSTGEKRGEVFSQEADRKVKIHMGYREVAIGDRVRFVETKCTVPTRGTPRQCDTRQVGSGKVVELVDQHDSVVELDGDQPLPKGAVAQRLEEAHEEHQH